MVFDFLRRAEPEVPEAKASATGRVVAWAGAGRVAWSPRDTVSLMKTGFTGNPFLRGFCANLRRAIGGTARRGFPAQLAGALAIR